MICCLPSKYNKNSLHDFDNYITLHIVAMVHYCNHYWITTNIEITTTTEITITIEITTNIENTNTIEISTTIELQPILKLQPQLKLLPLLNLLPRLNLLPLLDLQPLLKSLFISSVINMYRTGGWCLYESSVINMVLTATYTSKQWWTMMIYHILDWVNRNNFDLEFSF